MGILEDRVATRDVRRINDRNHVLAAGELTCASATIRHSDGAGHERGRPQLSSVEITAHRVAVEACVLELADDHADVLLAQILSPVTRNRDHDAGFVAEAPMARGLAAEFGKAVID
jgi:hypothetical protein